MTVQRPEPLFWLNDARGQFLPRDFATTFARDRSAVKNVSDEQWAILEAGPEATGDSIDYWETWEAVEANAIVTIDGVQYRVYQESDCWLIPVGMEWDDERDWFVWPGEAKEQVDA